MSKKTFIAFALLVAVLAVLIPWLAFQSDGDADQESASLGQGKSLFETNCGNCHTLSSAGTDGNFGPDLDELLAPTGPPSGEGAEASIKGLEGRVMNAIDNGVDSTTEPGRMPPGIISGPAAEEVAEFVARTAGQG
jgi:mono/diheme cytochrome c family protein